MDNLITHIGEPIGLAILLIIGVVYIIREIRPLLRNGKGSSILAACQAKDHLSAYAEDQANMHAGLIESLRKLSENQDSTARLLAGHIERMSEMYRRAEEHWKTSEIGRSELSKEHALAADTLKRIEQHVDKRVSR